MVCIAPHYIAALRERKRSRLHVLDKHCVGAIVPGAAGREMLLQPGRPPLGDPPRHGAGGSLVPVPGYAPRTHLPGPAGGLLYVRFDDGNTRGISPLDLTRE